MRFGNIGDHFTTFIFLDLIIFYFLGRDYFGVSNHFIVQFESGLDLFDNGMWFGIAILFSYCFMEARVEIETNGER